MASNVDEVFQLIEMLRSKCYPAAQEELRELTEFAKSNGYSGNELKNWDVPFWSTRLREKKYEYEEEQLRPYFPLDKVLSGLFALAERLFNIQIVAADGEAQVWHPDVRYFKIKDISSGKDIAYFFLDPYSRPADKKGGAWMNSCLGKSQVLDTLPVAYLVCNGSPPVGDTPSLMTFREVETLFHGMQCSYVILYCR
jgi:oligopeptidase A